MAELICDFVPDECAAVAIQMCILTKICRIELMDTPSFIEGLEALFPVGGEGGLVLDAYAEVDLLNECIIDTFTDAANSNGCGPIPIPPTPEAPDFTECLEAIERIKQEVTDPVAFLAPFMTIEFDSEFKPLRITVP